MEFNKLSWISQTRHYEFTSSSYSPEPSKDIIYLNEDYEGVETPEKIKTQLLPHQKVVVKAMLDLETKRKVNLIISVPEAPKFIYPIAETNAGILSDHLGSGKTFEILALICLNPVPKKIAEITSYPFIRECGVNKRSFLNRRQFQNHGFTCEVRKKYSKLLRQTLVFVNKSVLNQWYSRICGYTELKAYCVEGIHSMREFYNMIFHPNNNNNVNYLDEYDIILVKNGTISGSFDVPELKNTPMEKLKSKPIINIFGELFKNICFSRVVIDDFDLANINSNALVIPALFTWFVSATKKEAPLKRDNHTYNTIEQIIDNYRPVYLDVWRTRELDFFNICCNSEFINTSTNASKIKYYVYRFHNPNDKLIGALGAMGADIVMEMLNSGAVHTAADQVGIRSTSVSDIFERLLNRKWQAYKKNLLIDRYIPKAKEAVLELPDISDNAILTNTGIENLRKNIRKPGPLKQLKAIVKCRQPEAFKVIEEEENENNAEKTENGKEIERVKDNLREGDCPVMGVPLREVDSIIITKCCNMVISAECVTWALKMTKDTTGECPNCRTIIAFNDLILVDRDVDIDDIINEDIESEEEPEEEKEEEIDENKPDKLNCVISIIRGNQDKFSKMMKQCESVLIPGLLEGTIDKGSANPEDKKIIIFANYKETMDSVEKRLKKYNIAYAKLYGKKENMDNIVKRYWMPNKEANSIQVLLITGPAYCAGLDLQNTTDLIYTHKVYQKSVESQIAGRASRYGRKYNLNIHYIFYDNEYVSTFANLRNIKHLDDS